MRSNFSISSILKRRGESERPVNFTVHDTSPTLARPISQACTADQLSEPAYNYWCERIKEVPRAHRKQWEFCFIAQVLASGGVLVPGRRGLGFGVGNEPLPSLFASMGASILATDLAAEEAGQLGWVDTQQHAHSKDALNTRNICQPELFDSLVDFQFADMNDIPSGLGTFDFIWSSCAFEHLGSIKKGEDFIMKSSRMLAPGGIAVHTTELNCTSNAETLDNQGTVIFRRLDFERMGRQLAEEGFNLAMTFDLGDSDLDRHIDMPPFSSDKHLKLQLAKWVSTSFGLVIRRSQ